MSKRKMTASKKQLKKMYLEEKMTSTEIAEKYDCARGTVCKWLDKYNIKTRKIKGKNHGMWKGGRVDKGDGYVGIWKPEHPRADNQGYVFEHTLVVEKKYNRLPKSNEMVHHIDTNKHNNRIENLYLCTRNQHKKAHWSLEKLLPKLIERNIVGFDKKEGKYYLK